MIFFMAALSDRPYLSIIMETMSSQRLSIENCRSSDFMIFLRFEGLDQCRKILNGGFDIF